MDKIGFNYLSLVLESGVVSSQRSGEVAEL